MTTKIEWAEESWNPIVGCSIVSKGCTNCYAMKQAQRIQKINKTSTISGYQNPYDGTTTVVNGKPVWTGKVAMASQKALEKPLRTKKPTKFFVNSMGDLFHENVNLEQIAQVFDIMALCPQHTFIILTKRPLRMHRFLAWAAKFESENAEPSTYCGEHKKYGFEKGALQYPRKNVWLGVSVEDQATATERIPILLNTPAAVRFISAEPLLGEVDLTDLRPSEFHSIDALRGFDAALIGMFGNKLDWVIVGGESGKDARPMHLDWVRKIRDDCVANQVPFFFKQWGEFQPCIVTFNTFVPNDHHYFEKNIERAKRGEILIGSIRMLRRGKKKTGRTLDAKIYNEFPKKGGA